MVADLCIVAIFLLFVFIVIFSLSAQNGQESSKLSDGFIDRMLSILLKDLSIENKAIIIEKISFGIRKLAHFTLYFIVGSDAIMLLKTYKLKNKEQVSIALMIGVVFAVFDEIHQMFVGGRSGEIRDVCIDSCGAAFGMCIVWICWKVGCLIKKKISLFY